MQSINPYTNEVLANYKELSDKDIALKIQEAETAFKTWKKTSYTQRAQLLLKLAQLLEDEKQDLAKLISLEMGKPITESLAEIQKCAWVCRYYAEIGEKTLQDKTIKTDASASYVRYEPLGIILAIMPWNFPFWQYFRFFAPNAMAGNVSLLKHASNVCGCSLAIEKLILKAGFPPQASTSLLVSSKKVAQIIAHPSIKAASLTGSFAAGSAVASLCEQYIKKSVLELGGNNALIVFEDAEFENALDKVIIARFLNTGQSCIAGKRLLLHEKIYDSFLEKLVQRVQELRSGNPLHPDTQIGVLASEKFAEELRIQMEKALNQGAKILIGGKQNKAYFEPTLLTQVSTDMCVFTEETFGPLLAISKFKTEEEAVQLSNQSKFGLGVSIFTQTKARIARLIPQLEEGAVFINEFVKSDPRLPFGGIKESGYGRELSTDALFEFVNIKTIYQK